MKQRTFLNSILRPILIAVPLFMLIHNRVVRLAIVQEGPSQAYHTENKKSKTYYNIVLVDKTYQFTHHYVPGDMVMFTSPTHPECVLVQRIVAEEGTLMYDPRFLDYRYIPKAHCWVQIDDRFPKEANDDSYVFGPISMGLIHGKVRAILWPPKRYQWLRNK
jgi:hypothetical protein